LKLATEKIGGKRYTTPSAIRAFIAATSRASGGVPIDTRLRRAAIRRAEAELDADGID
jgi:hypothetical protein